MTVSEIPSLSFVVPGIPVPKARARVVRDKRTGKTRAITPAKTVNFEATVRLVASSAKPSGWPMFCEYKVRLHIVRARRGRGDGSNILKAVEDACNGITWIDDEHVSEFHVTRGLDAASPRTEVFIEAVPVACEKCAAPTLYPIEKRCTDCHAALQAKRARRAS